MVDLINSISEKTNQRWINVLSAFLGPNSEPVARIKHGLVSIKNREKYFKNKRKSRRVGSASPKSAKLARSVGGGSASPTKSMKRTKK